MRIIVCIKAVPDEVTTVELDPNSHSVRCAFQHLHMNESDEYALEQALALKRETAAYVEVICVGGTRHQDILYRALAKGADAATRIDADFNDDPQITATILAAAIRTKCFDIVLAGMESTDTMASQVGVAVAALLGLPHVSAVTGVQIGEGGNAVQVTKELGGGTLESLEVAMPALLCVQSGIQRLSYAAAVKLLRARRQSIPSLSLADLSLDTDQLSRGRLKFLRVFEPPKGQYAEILEGDTPTEIAYVLLQKITDVCGIAK